MKLILLMSKFKRACIKPYYDEIERISNKESESKARARFDAISVYIEHQLCTEVEATMLGADVVFTLKGSCFLLRIVLLLQMVSTANKVSLD